MRFFCNFFSFLRSYITVFTVIFLLVTVSIINYQYKGDFQNRSTFFSNLNEKIGNSSDNNIIIKSLGEENTQVNKDKYIPIAKIASTDFNIMSDLNNSLQENKETNNQNIENNKSELYSWKLYKGNSFLAPSVYYDKSLADNLKYGITKYTVVAGDTPSSIATSFAISTYTVLWANNLKVGDYIKPGQKLEILPVTGVKHIIKPGDTLKSIAKKYKADPEEIRIFNSLPADGTFAKGSEGKTLIIPNGKMKIPVYAPKPTPRRIRGRIITSSKYRPTNLNPKGGHRFPYGQCTWYVASKTFVPWGGNAKSWLVNARAYGYKTGRIPVVGSIVVTNENRWYGHVALVESVNANSITVSEMNYVGWARTSVRVIPINSRVIRGYIYTK